jgi:hypothetical protein
MLKLVEPQDNQPCFDFEHLPGPPKDKGLWECKAENTSS